MKDAAHLVNLIEMPYSGDNRSELSFEQIISITNKPAALLLSSILSFFPIESSEVDNTNNQNKSSIKEKIEDLKKSLEPIPVLEVNSQTVKDSLGNISNYLFNCVGSTISAFYDTSKKVIHSFP